MTSCINLVPFKGAEMYLGKQQFQVNDFMLLLLSSRSKHNFQHQTSNKGEVKHKQLVCVCKDTDSWNIRFSATLLSLATLSSSAFIKKKQVAAQPIRRVLEFPRHYSALSVVTSHGPLNGTPQTSLNGLMRQNTQGWGTCFNHEYKVSLLITNTPLWHM